MRLTHADLSWVRPIVWPVQTMNGSNIGSFALPKTKHNCYSHAAKSAYSKIVGFIIRQSVKGPNWLSNRCDSARVPVASENDFRGAVKSAWYYLVSLRNSDCTIMPVYARCRLFLEKLLNPILTHEHTPSNFQQRGGANRNDRDVFR
jgi:hypothetical protein